MFNKTGFFTRFLLIFFILVFAVPVYWVVRGKAEPRWSLIEYRHLEEFPSLPVVEMKTMVKSIFEGKAIEDWKRLTEWSSSRAFQGQFEKAVVDQFPMRSPAIQLSFGFDRLIIRLAYAFLDDPAIPADMSNSSIYESRDSSMLYYFPKRFRENDIQKIDATIASYNDLIQVFPDINFYAFYLEYIDRSEYNPLNALTSQADAGQAIAYFEKRLPEGLTLGKLSLSSFDDYLKYYYRSDHHWTIHGTLQAYELIYQMLAQNYPGISPIQPHDSLFTFPDIGFLGSSARRVFYQVDPPDVFAVAVLNLPPYRVLDKNGKEFKLNKMEEYWAGDYSTVPFTDHYIEYYGADRDYIEFVFENGSDRNLLIIGDSYVNSIETLLASHYHHTYSLDIRLYPDEYLSLSDFLADHPVDDVIFLGGHSQTISQNEWVIKP